MKSTNKIPKAFSFVISLLFLLVACSKHSNSDPVPSVAKPPVTSIYVSVPDEHILSVDSFFYDAYGRLLRFQRWGYDSLLSPQLIDSFDIAFSYRSGNDAVPGSYTMHSMNSFTNNPAESHLLYYDAQDRIVKDSMQNAPASGSVTNNAVVTNYGYNNNIIIVDNYQYTISGLQKAMTDSFFTNSTGNLTNKNHHYLLYSTTYSNEATTSSNYANPFYNKTWGAELGPLLTYVFETDYISPAMFSSRQFTGPSNLGIYNITYNYTWITDAKGRIIKNQPPSHLNDYTVHYNN